MRIVTSVAGMQRLATDWKKTAARVGLIPTMGYLHAGHLSLAQRARRAVGRQGRVVVSIYLNPTQFGPHEDVSRYPRDLPRDIKLCRTAGVDVVFAPDDAEMYPRRNGGGFSTYVVEEALSRRMEGASRPTHFRGVTTVVAKLFNIILPSVAVFGSKDFQQAAIIQQMVRDLNFPVKLIVAPTRREPDGLAFSSRNKYLNGPLREQAVCLWHALRAARKAVRAARIPLLAPPLVRRLKRQIESQPDARVDYIEFFDPVNWQPLQSVTRGTHLALAVFIGKTRLIDNARL